MSFFGVLGHDANPAAGFDPTASLPKAPPSVGSIKAPPFIPTGVPINADPGSIDPSQLPQVPPSIRVGRPNAFDADHRQQTLLALAAGFFGSHNLGEGLSNAASVIYNQNAGIQKEARPELGGPDDSFEIYTDPVTGQKTYKPVQAFQDYLEHRRVKSKDVADINGRVMYAIQQLPEDQRAAAYADVVSHPEHYGVDGSTLPANYDPNYSNITANMGMTVAQALQRSQAAQNADAMEAYREWLRANGDKRTNAYVAHSAASTAQGAARVAQGAQRVAQGGERIDLSRHNSARQDVKAGIINGYQYRRDPVTGQLQKRKVQ